MLWSAQMFRNLGLRSAGTPVGTAGVARLRQRLVAVAHPDDRARVASLLAEYAGRAGPMRIEYRIVRPDGRSTGSCFSER